MTVDNLHPTILLEIGKYYEHRHRANMHKIPWDKIQDIDLIFVACNIHGWKCEASCGTFWLCKNNTAAKVKECKETGLPKVEYQDKKAGEPFGMFAEITTALHKNGMEPRFIKADE